MGTELDAFPFQELINQTCTNPSSKTRSPLEILSSWLDIDEAYHHPSTVPSLHPQEHLPEFHVSDHDHLFHFDCSDFDVDPLSLLPRPDSPLLHGLYQSDQHTMTHAYHQPPVTADQTPPEPDECDTFLIDSNEFGLITPTESHDSGSDDHFYDPSSSGKLAASDYSCTVDTSEPMSIDNNSPLPAGLQGEGDADGEDNEEEEVDDEVPKPGAVHCKNLVSERNRRKRLSQQLLALRALVPNITKMDKRSVLVDALNYLRSIHEETGRLQKELKQQQQQQQQQQPPRLNTIKESCQDNPSGTLRVPRTASASKPKPQIAEIDTERIEDRRFVVKITCKGSGGVGGDILRVIESMGLEITNATVQQMGPQEMLATIFIKVRKPGKMTEEKLKDCITSMALRSGLTLQNP